MAYTKLRDMLELALELQVSSLGLTIDQLMARTGRSRKTVERMLQGLDEIGLEVEPQPVGKRSSPNQALAITGRICRERCLMLQPHERAALERHLQTLPEGVATVALTKLLGNQKPLSNHLRHR